MVSYSGFESGATTTNIGFRLLHPVRPSLDHRGLVDQVAVRAGAGGVGQF